MTPEPLPPRSMRVPGWRAADVATAAMLAVLTLVAHRRVLSYDFTGTDAPATIATSRADSLTEAAAVLSRPLMAGTSFLDVGRFWHPVSTASYALTEAAFGVSPFAFHLVDVVLHALVVVVLYALMRRLGVAVAGATIGSAVFSVHPALVSMVAANTRRHDVLAVLFTLLTLHAVLLSRRRRVLGIAWAAVGFALAVGAKEIGVIALPLAVLLHIAAAVSIDKLELRDAARRAGALAAPLVAVFVGYVVARVAVLGGMGGYARPGAGIATLLRRWAGVVAGVVSDILALDVVPPIGAIGSAQVRQLASGAVGVAVVAVLVSLARPHRHRPVAAALAAAFVVCPVAVYVVSATVHNHRSAYAVLVGLSILVGVAVDRGRVDPRALACASAVVAVTVGLSPLVWHYREWEASSRVSAMVRGAVASAAAAVPAGSTLVVSEIPDDVSAFDRVWPTAREVAYLSEYSLEGWLTLANPEHEVEVEVEREVVWAHVPCRLERSVRSRGTGATAAYDLELRPVGSCPP